MRWNQLSKLSLVSLLTVGILAACGDGESSGKSENAESGDVRVVKVAYDQSGKPMTYLDEKGNATGYE